MKLAKIPPNRFCASRVRRVQTPQGGGFSFWRAGEAIKRVLNRFNRVLIDGLVMLKTTIPTAPEIYE